jgi:Phage integrase family
VRTAAGPFRRLARVASVFALRSNHIGKLGGRASLRQAAACGHGRSLGTVRVRSAAGRAAAPEMASYARRCFVGIAAAGGGCGSCPRRPPRSSAGTYRHGYATGGELSPSLGVYRLVERTVRNATGDARQDGRGTGDASLESACASAHRAALGGSEDARRRLGMGDGNGKWTHRAFTVKKQHRLALRLSGVRPFVLYALRHTFLTRLGEAGCDAWTLARIAGHSSIAMSARYVHPSEDLVMNVFSRMDSVKGVLTESSETRH